MVNEGPLMRRLVSVFVCFAAGASGTPICPQVTPAAAPAWTDAVSNSSPGEFFLFSNLERTPRKPGQTLPLTVRTPQSPIGAYDGHEFPAGPLYYSNSSGASIVCLPGLDPSVLVAIPSRPPRTEGGCPTGQVGEKCAADGDCTGQRILRTPSSGIETTLANGITGIEYLGTFEGQSGAASGGLVEIVFFHQSGDYLAQTEYGILRDLSVPNTVTFYWQTNANCTLHSPVTINDTMCTTIEGNRQAGTYVYTDGLVPPGNEPITSACNIDLTPVGGFGLYYYSMWIYSDGGTLKFGMSIVDPNTSLPVVPETSIDPNVGAPSTWFPTATVNGASGYVTAGIARYDPFRSQTLSDLTPTMSIQRIEIGAASQ
jgi:hypothetical protein